MKSKEIEGKPKRNLWTIREELVQAIKELDFLVNRKLKH
jgi:5-methylcytosine-specific restriction protein A